MAGAQANIRNFISQLKGPGRTAPSLLQDLVLYDPTQRPTAGHLLEDVQRAISKPKICEVLPPDSCQHEFCLQKRQSKPPLLDERPTPQSVYVLAAVCRKCRLHLKVKIDYSVAWQDSPCPNPEHPLHHFLQSSWRQDAAYRDLQKEDPGSSDEIFVFECSSQTCSAILSLRLVLPILTDELVHSLVDKDLLAKRTDAAFELKKGHTEGMKRPTPIDVLTDLRAYIRNAWKQDAKTEINVENKRFAVRFGPDGTACADALSELRFVFKPGESWTIPRPDITEELPLQQSLNVFLDDAESELNVLIASRPQDETQGAQEQTKLDSANIHLARVLSCQDYDRYPAYRNARIDPSQRTRPFTILGVPEDASDVLVIFAYQRQMSTGDDELHQNAILMTALEEVQKTRGSEILAGQVAIERSMGRHTLTDISHAYKSLNVHSNEEIDDNHIIGCFNSLRANVSAEQKQRLKESLAIVGEHRGSRRLIDLARDDIVTYEDALSYLGAETTMDDSFITTMYTTKIADDVSNTNMARKAVRFIADHRNSENLKAFVASGYQGEIQNTSMDIGEAFSALGLVDRTFDDDTLYAIYESRVQDEPGIKDRLDRALRTIANEDKERRNLRERLGIANETSTAASWLFEPVGLDNIGNTCYLNSLLQWLFTIMPVREIVLDFDKYKMDISDKALANKRVGQRLLTRREVDTAQNFARKLADLFQQMITSPTKAIRPAQELARLTLETPEVKTGRRSSTLQSNRRPTLGTIDSQPVIGPLPRSAYTSANDEDAPLLSLGSVDVVDSPIQEKDVPMIDAPQTETGPNNLHQGQDTDESSDVTLISRPSSEDMTEVSPNPQLSTQQPHQPAHPQNLVPEVTALPQIDAKYKPTETTNTPLVSSSSTSAPTTNVADVPMVYAPPPGKPPPVPPRRPLPNETSTLEEYARQQDVTEVMQHTIIQLSSAIRPTGSGPNSEQEDEVHDTFYGESVYHILNAQNSSHAPTPFLSLQAAIYNDPKDVYAALDNEFDLQDRETGVQVFQSITKLPPVLTISYGRVVFDSATAQQKKVDCHIETPATLYMDRYLEDSANGPLLQRRQQAWQYKQELSKLLTRKHVLEKSVACPADEALEKAGRVIEYLSTVEEEEGLEGFDFPASCLTSIFELANSVRNERHRLDKRIAELQQLIAESFTDMRKHEYTLHAAFFHRGGASSGHYWIYMYDHKESIWRKYNDTYVTHVEDLNEIFGDPRDPKNPVYVRNGAPATPYFLVYIQSDQISKGLVETVKRDVVVPDANDGGQGDLTGAGNDDDWANASHMEYAGQPSQMSYMPPDSMAMREPSSAAHDTAIQEDEIDSDTEAAVAMSLQPHGKKEGDWDDSENMRHPRTW